MGTIRPSTLRFAVLVATIWAIIAAKAWDGFHTPQFWAEDGTDFFKDQFSTLVPNLLEPSSGYLHVVPRLVAWFAAFFSPLHAPSIYVLASTLLSAASLSVFAWRLRAAMPPWMMVAITALMPISTETHGTLANLQWFLQFALIAFVVYEHPTTEHTSRPWPSALGVLAIGLTGPFSIFIATTAVFFLVASPASRRLLLHPAARPAAVALLVAAVIQLLFVTLSGNSSLEGGSLNSSQWLSVAANLPDLLQGHFLAIAPNPFPAWLFAFLVIGIAAAVLVPAVGSPTAPTVMVAIALVCGLAQAFLGSAKNIHVPIELLQQIGVGDRYFVGFKFALWLSVFFVLARILKRREAMAAEQLTLALLVIATIAAPTHLRRPPLEDKRWDMEISAYLRGEKTSLAINPTPWTVDLPPIKDFEGNE